MLSNWRPISLLNHCYKILSGVLAERLKPTLPTVIHQDQKGFVRGRYIGECIRSYIYIIEYAKNNNKIGLLLMIDFEKAFDSISHSFIIKTLKFFGYGYSFIKWINLILHDLSSCINHCGNITERFSVGRSCRQGDPISPYLFILCAEILALKIRQDPGVSGFKIGNWQHKLDMYADDLTCYLDGSENSLRSVISILDEFRDISGLKINLGKCKAVWIGRNRFSNLVLCPDLKLIWSDTFTLLGIEFDSDLAKMDTNFKKKVDIVENIYKSWLYRKLTPLGKITIIKTMAFSQLSHVILVCPHLEQDAATQINRLSFQFLWSNKPDRMKRAEAVLPISQGGLNMPEIQFFWESLKCSWARRLMNYDAPWHKILQANILACGFDLNDLLFAGPDSLKKCSTLLTNKFWKETIGIFAKLISKAVNVRPKFFYNLNIFDNQLFKFGSNLIRKFYFPMLWSKRVQQAGDLFDCSVVPPRLLDRLELNSKYSLNLDFLRFHQLKVSILNGLKVTKIRDQKLGDFILPRLPILFKISTEQEKGCNFFYQIVQSNEKSVRFTEKSESKWHDNLGITLSVQVWDKIYKLPQKMLVPNKLIWTQIQINKHLLPTNYTVNQYDSKVSPVCSFCPNHPEKLYLLAWGCDVVQQFWIMVSNLISNFFPKFSLGKKEAIFGAPK